MDLGEHVYQCWRKGYKTSKIIETFDKEVSEKDVKDKFKFIVESYWESR